MKRVSLVTRDLDLLQNKRRAEIAKEMIEDVAEDHTIIKRIITGDEMCVYEYHVETIQ